MATSRKHTAPAKAQSSRSTRAARNAEEARKEICHLELVGARAATMTAILALDHAGVERHIAMSLRRHVLDPIESVLKMTGDAP